MLNSVVKIELTMSN